MLRQMEEQMRNVRVEDLLVQSVVSILNLAARRIVKEDERDLEQARLGIDAVAALVDLLDPEAQHEIKNALSQVQMLYAQHAGGPPRATPGPPDPPRDRRRAFRSRRPASGPPVRARQLRRRLRFAGFGDTPDRRIGTLRPGARLHCGPLFKPLLHELGAAYL